VDARFPKENAEIKTKTAGKGPRSFAVDEEKPRKILKKSRPRA
jgi:hypothetical protein